MDEEINDASSNPLAKEHLPVAGEIAVEDERVDDEILEDITEQ